MVQIILVLPGIAVVLLLKLYIPHGSDNTRIFVIVSYDIVNLYIPHGSDNTYHPHLTQSRYWNLYIPHGSDNTPPAVEEFCWFVVFISHMVQIILRQALFIKTISRPLFISHMVQIIQLRRVKCVTFLASLYPTWFR